MNAAYVLVHPGLQCLQAEDKVTSPQARPSRCEGIPISNTDVSLTKVSEIVMPIYNISKCLVYDK